MHLANVNVVDGIFLISAMQNTPEDGVREIQCYVVDGDHLLVFGRMCVKLEVCLISLIVDRFEF